MVTKHDRFYGNTVTFLVEDCLFKVPREPFERESAVFKDMFSLPVGKHEAEGMSDENPIQLAGTKKGEFEQLLSVLFYRCNSDQGQELPRSVEQWTSVLKLSTAWGFNRLRQIATLRLGTLASAVDKIVLGNTYDLDEETWILPAMQQLVRRPEPISVDEGSHLGLEVALKLASVREQVTFREVRGYNTVAQPQVVTGRRPNVTSVDFTNILRSTFFPQNLADAGH